MTKISIVLPTYNGEKYIKESIESIINQTFLEWELIIVDDCSTDNTGRIVENYAKKDNRIRVIHNEKNQKLPRSLNIGFQYAKGEYFTWTSDDNIFKQDALFLMKDFLDHNNCTYMVRADMDLINDKSQLIGTSAQFCNNGMISANLVGACFLYRNEVLKKIGGYSAELFCVEDYDYWLRILENFGEIGNIEKKLYAYRRHSGSLTEMKKNLVRNQYKKLRKKHLNYFISHIEDSPRRWFDLYIILIDCGMTKKEIPAYIYEKIPCVIQDSRYKKDAINIVYGAGDYGDRAYNLLDGDILFYIDSNKNLQGSKVNGIEVKSLQDSINYIGENTNVIIALSQEKIYDVVCKFHENNVLSYITYNYLEQQFEGGKYK